jgi:flagellar hook protein FlgE
MLRSLSTAVSGLDTEQTAMDITGNNIANASTTGFKSTDVQFGSLLSQVITDGTVPNASAAAGGSNPQAVGLGVGIAGMNQQMGQGSIEETGVPTDLALQGNGFFLLSSGQGDFLSRAGDMQLDADGHLVEGATGWTVQGWSALTNPPTNPPSLNNWTTPNPTLVNTTTGFGNITIPSQIQGNGNQGTTAGTTYSLQSFAINADGTVTGVYAATTGGTTTTVSVTLGQIAVAAVPNPGGLIPSGNTAYTVGPNAGAPYYSVPGDNGVARITAGALEMSNVNLAQEMSNLVTFEAGYQADAKVISTAQQLIQALLAMKQ